MDKYPIQPLRESQQKTASAAKEISSEAAGLILPEEIESLELAGPAAEDQDKEGPTTQPGTELDLAEELPLPEPDLKATLKSRKNRRSRVSRDRVYIRLTLEGMLYSLIILFAVFTRFWDLDLRALHHDEGVHAYYSWLYYSGDGYEQEPWKHGPFVYHITALSFWLFGPGDLTARLPVALFGVLICLMPILLRRELGRWGTLTASFLLAVSPTFLYFTRFIREDIFMAFATLLLFSGLVRFVRQPSARWWYISMIGLGWLYLTKEASYFYTILFGGFIFLWMCWQIAPRLILIFTTCLAVSGFTFFFVAGVYTPPRIPYEQISGPALSNYINELLVHPIFWTSIILIITNVMVAWFAFREAAVSRLDFLRATGRVEGDVSPARALFLPYEKGSPAFAVGWLGQRWKVVGTGFLIFFGIYSVFYTGFFSSPLQGEVGLISGLWYWMAQQGVERGAQPWYYYLFMLPLYEPLALLFGTVGAGFIVLRFGRFSLAGSLHQLLTFPGKARTLAKKPEPHFNDGGDELDELEPSPEDSGSSQLKKEEDATGRSERAIIPLRRPGNSLWPGRLQREAHPYFTSLLLVVWAFGSLGFYTWASEKMPWLTIQIALPFILLAAYLFQGIWQGLEHYLGSEAARKISFFKVKGYTAFWVMCGGIAISFGLAFIFGLFLTASALRISGGGNQYNWLLIWVPPLLVLLIGAVGGKLFGFRIALYATLAVSFGMLSLFLIHTGFAYAFYQGDTPVEMGIYTQTAPDLLRTVKQLDKLTTVLPDNKQTPVLYDDEMRTPLDFYLRDYSRARKTRDFDEAGLQSSETGKLSDYPIIMLTDAKLEALDESQKELLASSYINRHLVFRWWFAEEPYRNFDQTSPIQIDFLRGKASKVTVKDAEGKVIISQGEIMNDEKLNLARDARGKVLDKLYNGNGGNTSLLNLTDAVKSTAKLANPVDFSRLWRFVFYREQVQPLGHLDFTLYIRNDIAGLYRQYADLVPYPISQP